MRIGFKLVGQGGVSMKMCRARSFRGRCEKRVDQFCRFFRTGLHFLFADFMQILHFAGQGSLFFYRVRLISLIPAVFFISESLSLY